MEVLRVARARIDELMAKRAFVLAQSKQAKFERETLDAHVLELEVSAATCNGELGIVTGLYGR